MAAEIEMLHAAGIHNINIDLIAGLSGQTAATWRESLDWIERLAPEHVSVYMLEVDDDSRLGREMLLGGVRYGAVDTPSDEATADFYEMAVERLAALGIARYEISNFARPGIESRHNLKYWNLRALRRLRRRRALLRRPHALAEPGIARRLPARRRPAGKSCRGHAPPL